MLVSALSRLGTAMMNGKGEIVSSEELMLIIH